ncbi:Glutathione S-transferase-like protein 17 [Elsinoe fawcettii]|nr:Glutathione S-transferase-like protein 17 [Elsinoe fawcettii]
MSSSPSSPIRFYDIPSAPPTRTYAPNPWKTRLALNAKGLAYVTEWTPLLSLKRTRKDLGVAPVRKLPSGKDFYTLPMIHDPATDKWVGDSFDIAVYLDAVYPDRGVRLFPEGSIGAIRVVNEYVNALFSRHAILMSDGLSFLPGTEEESKAEWVRRYGVARWEDLTVQGEERVKVVESLKRELEEFSGCYKHDGPFLEGEKLTYADFVVGAWLKSFKEVVRECKDMKDWQGGRWERLLGALEKYSEIK